MLYRLIFLLCFSTLSLISSSVDETSPFSVGPPPDWVNECSFSIEPIATKPCQVNLQYLLIESQYNWEEKIRYNHRAIKVLSQAGVDNLSQFTIDFDTFYQRVNIHTLRLIRNGQILDRLSQSRQKLIQREEELENNLYRGSHTLVYFLDDIRVGDIIEYAWSVTGVHPFFSTHFADMIMLQNQAAAEKLVRRILIHPDCFFRIKAFHTSQEPRVQDLSPTLREWSWEVTETLPFTRDSWQPSWYSPIASVQLSQYESWQDVVEKIIPLYRLPKGFLISPPSDMVALIKTWKDSPDSAQRALFALRFVQDEIRYLGFEDGLGSHRPTDPQIVFQRRFGDCKDKTLLLQALLQFMGIPSTPILVHSEMGRRLPELLPTPHVFNHVILRIEIEDKIYFVDPTLNLQGGSLQNNFFPDYHWGLPIVNKGVALIPLPSPSLEKPLKIDTSIILTSPLSAEIKIDWTYSGFEADKTRRMILSKGQKKISENYLEDAQKQYRGATVLSPLEISDDPIQNILILSESYKVPIRTRGEKRFLKIPSQIIDIYLDDDITLERTSPYQLHYPQWITEHIQIENPYHDWVPDSEDLILEHESLYYNYSLKKEGHIADINQEIKHLKDHVSVNAIREYWNIVSEIESNPPIEVTIPVKT